MNDSSGGKSWDFMLIKRHSGVATLCVQNRSQIPALLVSWCCLVLKNLAKITLNVYTRKHDVVLHKLDPRCQRVPFYTTPKFNSTTPKTVNKTKSSDNLSSTRWLGVLRVFSGKCGDAGLSGKNCSKSGSGRVRFSSPGGKPWERTTLVGKYAECGDPHGLLVWPFCCVLKRTEQVKR